MAAARKTSEKRERVALYARISEDKKSEGAGVARQLEDLRALAKARGWSVSGVYQEKPISAFSGARRPEYTRLMDAVDAREIDRVGVWHLSRLWRNRSDRVRGLERFREAGVSISAVRGPELDLSSATGRMLANLVSEFDSYESDLKAERVTRAAEQRAREGRANGAIPYGFRAVQDAKKGTVEPDPVEGPEVVAMIDAVIAGKSLRQICADLNDRGVPTPRQSKKWMPSTVIKTIRRPAVAGLRQYQGEIIGKAQWKPLVTKARWEKACAVLSDPSRKTNLGNESERKYLLSYSVGRCGVCGEKLRVVTRQGRYGKPQTIYACDGRGCTGRNHDKVDALVRDVVLTYLEQPVAKEATRTRAASGAMSPAEELESLRSRLDDAVDAYAAGGSDIWMLTKIRAELTPRTSELEASQSVEVVDRKALTRRRSTKDREQAWDAMSIHDRHAVVAGLFNRVVLDRVKRKGPGFDPESVRFEWRSD